MARGPEVVEMVVPRNYVLRSTKGHAIAFEKNKAMLVPKVLIEEVLAIGGSFVEEKEAEDNFKEVEARKTLTEVERQELLKETFDALINKNDPTDFTGSGMPSVRAIEVITGINYTTKEVKQAWLKYHAEKNAENKE